MVEAADWLPTGLGRKLVACTLQGMDTYPTLGKGKSSTQNAILGGYVSSLEGIF